MSTLRLGEILATPTEPDMMVGDLRVPFLTIGGRRALSDLQLCIWPWLGAFVEQHFDHFERDDDWALWFWTKGETRNVVRNHDA
jgi:hypothetical protein